MGFSFGGMPYFDGAMTSEGSGARVRLDVKDLPIIGDVNVVNVSVPGFAKGGQIPDDRAARSQASLARLHRQHGTSGERSSVTRRAAGGALPTNRAQATEANIAARRRQGGASAPTRRNPNPPRAPRHTGGRQTGIGADMAALTPASVGLSGGGPVGFHAAPGARREKWEICPGIACPLCAAGIMVPVR
ncbi:hypothetical protein GII32_10675 [Gordonia amarae]|uniref:hypothetical protein n=1 Tax=Gordonia amarae TaxID=36821 RepID=UPI001AF50B05|nr:hypothetical protein [Gordonia amarae]QHN30783.1 hypothetical protein GII32_10675 [Gordonia amarae]